MSFSLSFLEVSFSLLNICFTWRRAARGSGGESINLRHSFIGVKTTHEVGAGELVVMIFGLVGGEGGCATKRVWIISRFAIRRNKWGGDYLLEGGGGTAGMGVVARDPPPITVAPEALPSPRTPLPEKQIFSSEKDTSRGEVSVYA